MSFSDIKLNINETNEIIFDILIEGNFERMKEPEFRLFCEEKNFSFSFQGKKTENGNIKFIVPKMENLIPTGKYNFSFEVILDEKRFIPMKFEGEFIKEVSIKTESVSVRKEVEKIDIKNVSVQNSNPKQIKKINAKVLRGLINEIIKKG